MDVLSVEILCEEPHEKREYRHYIAQMDIDIPYLSSKDGSEYADCDDPRYETVFVMEDFEGEVFSHLKHSDNRVLGSPVVMHVAATNEPLPYTYRPQYCSSMQGLNVCFTNFKTKEHLTRLITLCHYMGACVKKDISSKIDFLVTNVLHGPKYRTAVSLGIPVMREDWIHNCWMERRRHDARAGDDEFVTSCKAKPFEGCTLSFLGFSEREQEHMQQQAEQQGGKFAEVGHDSCTHLVVDEDNVKSLSFEPHDRLYVVLQEWFWGSIQIEARAAESMYLFDAQEDRPNLTRSSTTSSLLGTPYKWRNSNDESSISRTSSSSKHSFTRKRSRMREETLAKLAQDSDKETGKQPPNKRQSTETSSAINESLLDISNNTTAVRSPKPKHLFRDSPAKRSVSARFQVVMELLQTERNYVGILNTILNLFKKPLEDPKQAGGPILPIENIKAIFGSLPEIHDVHSRMAEELKDVMETWSDTSSIGCVIIKYASEFVRCYPPFVNFFEMSKETISSCESSMPRFHAFLKINQAKKECGRQTLAELLINPVQRLPRIILLLQDIKKHTQKENPNHTDVEGIQAALNAVKETMTHINEDKRKTESQKQIFDIYNEVEGCPPTFISSHRQFITRAEVIAIDDNLTGKGDHVCLLLFSDCVELAKRKRGVKNPSFKSPSVHTKSSGGVRCLRHIKLLSLSHIKKVVDIKNSEDCHNAFALFCRTPTDCRDWLYTFKMLSCTGGDVANDDKSVNSSNCGTMTAPADDAKNRLLQLIARNRASTVCKTSDDNFIHTLASQELDISTADATSTLGKAVRAAKKSHKKLTRAFSFSRTPKRVVERAVSTMISPATRMDGITPGLGATPSRARPVSVMDTEGYFTPDRDCEMSSGLTPGMSVSSLCTPQMERRVTRLSSASSMQIENEENLPLSGRHGLKPSVSMMSLRGPQRHKHLSDVKDQLFQVPTPPQRRKRAGAAKAVRAATMALGRAGSFRKKIKGDPWL